MMHWRLRPSALHIYVICYVAGIGILATLALGRGAPGAIAIPEPTDYPSAINNYNCTSVAAFNGRPIIPGDTTITFTSSSKIAGFSSPWATSPHQVSNGHWNVELKVPRGEKFITPTVVTYESGKKRCVVIALEAKKIILRSGRVDNGALRADWEIELLDGTTITRGIYTSFYGLP
jgi:hypothetical protein